MPRVGVVTDSVACLPQELVERYGIYVVPISIAYQGQLFRDGVDITPEQLYELMPTAEILPTTTPSSPGEYLEAFQELGQKVENILAVCLSSRVSSTFNSARVAKELAEKEFPHLSIEVLDSRTAAMAEGFVALAAARAAEAGMGLQEVRAAAQDALRRVDLIVMLETLTYLARGGRIPKAAAWAGSVLSLRPILRLNEEGEVVLVARARTRPGAVARLLALGEKSVGRSMPVQAAVMHAHVPEQAEVLKEQVLSRFNCSEFYLTEFTPVMGVHTGPGVLAVAFCWQG